MQPFWTDRLLWHSNLNRMIGHKRGRYFAHEEKPVGKGLLDKKLVYLTLNRPLVKCRPFCKITIRPKNYVNPCCERFMSALT